MSNPPCQRFVRGPLAAVGKCRKNRDHNLNELVVSSTAYNVLRERSRYAKPSSGPLSTFYDRAPSNDSADLATQRSLR